MKKILALILALLLLLPLAVACGKDKEESSSSEKQPASDEPDDSSDTNKPDDSSDTNKPDDSSDTSTPGSSSSDDDTTKPDFIDPSKNILDTWSGKTLNILATRWKNDEPACAPWTTPELLVKTADDDTNFGRQINNTILARAEKIRRDYGVTLNWIECGPVISQTLQTDITEGIYNYNIAMPRMLEAMTLVSDGVVRDMAYSQYIDFSQPYFNQMAYESYTAYEHTFFAAGDTSFMDESVAYLIYYNKTKAASIANFPDLYELVRNGGWTIDVMYSLAAGAGGDDGDGVWTNNDNYGLGTATLNLFYQFLGMQQVGVDPETQEFTITLNDSKIGTVIEKIIQCNNATWARTSWSGDGPGLTTAFAKGQLLFLNEVVQNFDHIADSIGEGFDCGLLPVPKLDTDQERYTTPVANQAELVCIPKTTDDVLMSEYFVSVLAFTGTDVVDAYIGKLTMRLPDDESIEMLEDYIFPGMIYDVGYMHGYDGLLNSLQYDSFKNGTNQFATLFSEALPGALETVTLWNDAWGGYSDED